MRLFLLAAATAVVALIGALRIIAAPSPQLPPLHPELLAPKTITIAATPETQVRLPDLTGGPLDAALNTLHGLGLGLGPEQTVQVKRRPAPNMVDKVAGQDPAAGARVDRRTLIVLYLGQ